MSEIQTAAEVRAAYEKMTPAAQALFVRYMEYRSRQEWTLKAIDSGMRLNRPQIKERVRTVAKALDLPDSQINTALKFGRSLDPLVEFARRYNQDVDWLIGGDTGSMCRRLAWAGGWRPDWWTPELETASVSA